MGWYGRQTKPRNLVREQPVIEFLAKLSGMQGISPFLGGQAVWGVFVLGVEIRETL